MKTFGKICYTVCQISIGISLLLALIMIWGEMTDEFMWKALGSSLAFFFAFGIALSVNKEFQKDPKNNNEEKK